MLHVGQDKLGIAAETGSSFDQYEAARAETRSSFDQYKVSPTLSTENIVER